MESDAAPLRPPLTFALIDEKIQALPEGPVEALNSPRWMVRLNALGLLAMVMALSPSLLLQWFTPKLWMLWMARSGFWVMLAAFTPFFLRALWLVFAGLRASRKGFIRQLDHDVAQRQRLRQWLLGYPRQVLEERLRFADFAQQRMAAKLGLMIGSIDKLGLLPVLLSAFVVLRNWRDLLALPSWLAMLGIFPVVLWGIGWFAANFRLRLQLYQAVLTDALQLEASHKIDAVE